MINQFKPLSAVLRTHYNPPIRGRFSKKSRIRKKANKRYKRTLSWFVSTPSYQLTIDDIIKAVQIGQTR